MNAIPGKFAQGMQPTCCGELSPPERRESRSICPVVPSASRPSRNLLPTRSRRSSRFCTIAEGLDRRGDESCRNA